MARLPVEAGLSVLCYHHFMTTNLQKAGAIIIRKQGDEIEALLIFRKKQQDWSFPKGHIEADETPEAAAKREVKEEAGINIAFIRQLPLLTYPNNNNDLVSLFLFLAHQDNRSETDEHHTDSFVWIPLEQVADRLTHGNLKTYFNEYEKLIRFN